MPSIIDFIKYEAVNDSEPEEAMVKHIIETLADKLKPIENKINKIMHSEAKIIINAEGNVFVSMFFSLETQKAILDLIRQEK